MITKHRAVSDVSDEELIAHMESLHPEQVKLKFVPGERLETPKLWRTFHETLHRLSMVATDHEHEESKGMKPQPLNFHEKQEEVWVTTQPDSGNHGIVGVSPSEVGAAQLPGIDPDRPSTHTKTILYRPSLAPIYGGPTLLEALWNEMDRLMEALMTGATAEDGGDKYRAQELAWVLAIVEDAYNPDVNRIRSKAVDRWNEQQGAIQESEEEQHNWDAAGVSGYEL